MAAATPPKYIKNILFALRSRGHAAYLVGGCVRDVMLGLTPNDWDICTSAMPEQIMEIFPDSDPTGIRQGTITVKSGKRSAEVTTFRSESNYTDHRHPDSVMFVGDLVEDLRRRDFTVNSIAYSVDGVVVDPFGGRADLEAGILRCVGDPMVRFEEDALRMFRALRFSARFGFQIEEATLAAIRAKSHLSEAVSAERVRDEMEKLLISDHPEYFGIAVETGLMDRFLTSRPADLCEKLSYLPSVSKKATYRWASLAHTLEAEGCIPSVREFLFSLHIDSRTLRCCTDAAQILHGPILNTTIAWKKCLSVYGVDSVQCAAEYYDAKYHGQACDTLRSILKSGECFSVSHLAVTGRDLLNLGYKGKALGEILAFLLDYVIEHPEFNSRELLLTLITGMEET